MIARKWLLGSSLWLAASGCAYAADQSCTDSQYGANIASEVCATCHIVTKDQKTVPALREPTPSFFDIASKPTTTAQTLRAFITTTHWDRTTFPMQMPRLALSPEQLDAVVCYILSLRPRASGP